MDLHACWIRTRDPIVAALIEKLSPPPRKIAGRSVAARDEAWHALDDVADRTTMLATFAIGTSVSRARDRFARIAAWEPDPRVSTWALGQLDKPAYPSEPSLPLWEAMFGLLVRVGDPRAPAQLERLAQRTWPGPKRLAAVMRDRMRSTSAAITRLAWPSLTPDELAQRDALVAQHLPHVSGSALRTETELLAEIYRTPDDLDVRRVYGDVLDARGDPRGLFVALQSLETPTADQRKTMAALLRKHAKTWLGPLAAIAGTYEFAHGFPTHIGYSARYAATMTSLAGAPEWSTVVALDFIDPKTIYGVVELITHPIMRSLREVRGLTHLQARALADRRAPFERLGFVLPGATEPLDLARFPNLREVTITDDGSRIGAWIETARACPALEHLAIGWAGSAIVRLSRGATGRLDAITLRPDPDPRWAMSARAAMIGYLRALPAEIRSLAVDMTDALEAADADETLARAVTAARVRLGLA